MDTKSAIILAIIGTSAFTELVKFVLSAISNRKSRKTGVKAQLDRIEEKQDRIEEKQNKSDERLERLEKHDKLQYQALLRLTVMNDEMPMSERLMAGQEYVDGGGNGDVRHYFENMKAKVDSKEAEAS